MKKRIVSFLLALVMAVSLLPVSAFAVDGKLPDVAGTTLEEIIGSTYSTMKADLFRQVCFSYASMQTFVLSFAPPLHAACNCWNCSKETLNSTSSV